MMEDNIEVMSPENGFILKSLPVSDNIPKSKFVRMYKDSLSSVNLTKYIFIINIIILIFCVSFFFRSTSDGCHCVYSNKVFHSNSGEGVVIGVKSITTNSSEQIIPPTFERSLVDTGSPQVQMKSCVENIFGPYSHQECKIEASPHPDVKQCNSDYEPEIRRHIKKLLFVSDDYSVFRCLMFDKQCGKYTRPEIETRLKHYPLKDAYFNYIYSPTEYVCQGRPLSCSFNEHFIPGDHTNTLIIGILYCPIGPDHFSPYGLKRFIDCLRSSEVLAENFSMVFDTSCKQYVTNGNISSISGGEISFSNDNSLNLNRYFESTPL